ncbi:MAG: right-handed parallel beta-helix repeat-containing protein [Planctomycetota bacterium]|nr:right-handed parallel beta-helix repeat-containing protein [Planctomycetota bacterium]
MALSLALAACGGGGGGGGPAAPAEPQFIFDGPILYVSSTADSGPGTLRQALADASDGSQIRMDPAIHGQTITLLDWVGIDKSVLINGGPSGNEVTISGGNATGMLEIQTPKPVLLRSLHFVDGNGNWAGVIRNLYGNLNIQACTFHDNQGSTFGGVITNSGRLLIQGSHFASNRSDSGGVIHAFGDHDTKIERSSFVGNWSTGGNGGGALYMRGGRTIIESSTFHMNSTFGNDPGKNVGGAIRIRDSNTSGGGTLEIYGSTLTNNVATETGGGIHVGPEPGNTLVVRQSILALNTGGAEPDAYVHGNVIFGATESHYNVIGEAAGGPFWNGIGNNQVGVALAEIDPLLGPLGPLPGMTWGRVPLAGSPARDVVPVADVLNADGLPLERDQINQPRIDVGNSDVGALEH